MNFEEILQHGMSVTSFIRTLNGKYIGKSVFCQIANCVISITIKIFLLVSLSKSPISTIHTKSGLIFYIFMTFIRLFVLIESGQKFSRTVKMAREITQDIIFKHGDQMNFYLQMKYQILLSKLDISEPYRPLDAFPLNTSFGVTVSGLILTYTIVLLQFWITEKQSFSKVE